MNQILIFLFIKNAYIIIFYQFIKFCIVGFSGLVIDFGITYLFKEKVKINKYIAHSIGFTFAVVNNYLLNKYWTFEDKEKDILTQGGKFIIIAIVGLLISNQIIYLLNNRLKIDFYISKLLAVGVVVLWNFFANFYFTFSH